MGLSRPLFPGVDGRAFIQSMQNAPDTAISCVQSRRGACLPGRELCILLLHIETEDIRMYLTEKLVYIEK